MTTRFARLTLLCLLVAVLMSAAAQDAPTITISPDSGEVEQAAFSIEIDGLQPDTRYQIAILFAGGVVFGSEEKSDQAGHIYYPISSTAGDAPGLYTVQVLLNDEAVASASFTLTAPDSPAPEAARDILGDVTVSPETVPFGKRQKLQIADLAPNTEYTIEITARETGAAAYRRSHRSDGAGLIEIEVFAEEGDAAGLQAIAVYDAAGELIAAGIFTILPPPERDLGLTLFPSAVAAGETVEIRVSGLAAFDSVTAQISSADGVLIDTVLARATSDGAAALAFTAPAALPEGQYAIDIFVEGDLLGSESLIIGESPLVASEAKIVIDPPQAPLNSRHAIGVSGFAAGQALRLIILDPDGGEEYSAPRQADDAGKFSLIISSTEDDDAGLYRVEVRDQDGGDLLASAAFEITAASAPPASAADAAADAPQAIAAIEPQSAPIGSSHVISLRNLAPHETVSIDVVFAGELVFSTEKTADADGRVALELVTDEADQPGDYLITARRLSGNQPSVVLTATAKAMPAPSTAIIGEAQVIESRLDAGAARLRFEGEANRYVLISVSSQDFDPAFALIDRAGAQHAFNDDARGQKTAIIGPLRLPYSGEYELAISAAPLMMPQGAESGDFTAAIRPIELRRAAFDADLSFALSADSPSVYFALPLEVGDRLSLRVDSGGGLDTQLGVVSPAGDELAFDDDSGSGFDAELSNLVFERAGDHVLVVSAFDAGASGAGTVHIARQAVRSLDDGEVIIRLNDKAIRDLVVFEADEDELLVLNLEALGGDVEDLYVTATIDGMEVMSYSTMGVPDALPLAFVTPMSGRVVVAMEKFGFDDGITLAVSLERP